MISPFSGSHSQAVGTQNTPSFWTQSWFAGQPSSMHPGCGSKPSHRSAGSPVSPGGSVFGGSPVPLLVSAPDVPGSTSPVVDGSPVLVPSAVVVPGASPPVLLAVEGGGQVDASASAPSSSASPVVPSLVLAEVEPVVASIVVMDGAGAGKSEPPASPHAATSTRA